MSSDGEIKYSRSRDAIFASVDEEVVALNIDSGYSYGFDRIASAVWELLEQPRTMSELCVALQQDYDVEPDRCREDVDALLQSLASEKLVTIVPHDRPGVSQ